VRQDASSVRPGIASPIKVSVVEGAIALFRADDGRRIEPAA